MPNRYSYIPLNQADWLASTAILTPAARGIWMDLICAMWMDGRNDHVKGTAQQLSRIARCTPMEISSAIEEFVCSGIADVSSDGEFWVIVCRRFRREKKQREGHAGVVRKSREKRAMLQNVTTVTKKIHECDYTETTTEQGTCEERDQDVTGYARVIPKFIYKYPSLNPAPCGPGREGPREGRGGEGDSEGYPSSAAEVMDAASSSGYRLSEGQAAEWLRMKQADGWKDSDERPIVSWRRLLSSWCKSSGVQTAKAYEEQLEREARRQEAERQRRIAERRAADEANAAMPKLDVSQALALMKL